MVYEDIPGRLSLGGVQGGGGGMVLYLPFTAAFSYLDNILLLCCHERFSCFALVCLGTPGWEQKLIILKLLHTHIIQSYTLGLEHHASITLGATCNYHICTFVRNVCLPYQSGETPGI